MKRDLTSLIRMQRWRVDAERRAVADRQAVVDDLHLRLSELHHQLGRERRIAEDDAGLAGQAWPTFAQAALSHRRDLLAGLQEAEQALDAARDGLTDAYRQQRSLELAEEARRRQLRAERQRREQADLDEVASQRAARSA